MFLFFRTSQRNVFIRVFYGISILGLYVYSIHAKADIGPTPSLQQMVAQKLLIDLRYYCDDPQSLTPSGFCQEAMTTLPPSLASMLSNTQVGGVILFSENLVSGAQILALTHALQQSLMMRETVSGQSTLPLYIAVDQEGGRVSRLPNQEFLGFSGNMAIGATYQQHGVLYAAEVARHMASSLHALGFNVNFAPSLDVNSNPDNPIINVRAFSQSAHTVAKLGAAQIHEFQQKNIAAAAKHFPGHGDTHVDSHVGLPRVEHSKDTIDAIDIFPFKYAIENADVDMIMTAHIQYPALDSTTFVSTDGRITELPATLSHTILTGLLREELKFSGLIVTDALDMQAISQFLSPIEATIKAFEAGADIALMPFRISSKAEAQAFEQFLHEITAIVAANPALRQLVRASYQRIVAHKQTRKMHLQAHKSLAEKQQQLQALQLSSQQHILAQALGKDALTVIKTLSEPLKVSHSVYAVMPDKRRCDALTTTLRQVDMQQVVCVSQLSEDILPEMHADTLIIGDLTPALSFFESRAFEGIEAAQRKNIEAQQAQIKTLLANSNSATKVLLKLRSPYLSEKDFETFDAIYASYDYQVANHDNGLFAPAFSAFAGHLLKQNKASGVAPVTLLLPTLAPAVSDAKSLSQQTNQ